MADTQSNIDDWQKEGHRFVDNMATVMRDLYLWRDALILVMYSLGINEKIIEQECLEELSQEVYGKSAKVNKTKALEKMLEHDIQGTFNFRKIKTMQRILL